MDLCGSGRMNSDWRGHAHDSRSCCRTARQFYYHPSRELERFQSAIQALSILWKAKRSCCQFLPTMQMEKFSEKDMPEMRRQEAFSFRTLQDVQKPPYTRILGVSTMRRRERFLLGGMQGMPTQEHDYR